MAKLTQDELIEQVTTQRKLLQLSMDAFDAGNEVAALQLAVTIRVLVHDTTNSASLLQQLGVKDSWQWITAASPVDKANVNTTWNLTLMAISAEGPVTWEPQGRDYLEQFQTFVTFDEWWKTPVVKDENGAEFHRRGLVLVLANKAGGAHVDKVPKDAEALRSQGSLGWESLQSGLITQSPIEPSVRTIAEELAYMIDNNPIT